MSRYQIIFPELCENTQHGNIWAQKKIFYRQFSCHYSDCDTITRILGTLVTDNPRSLLDRILRISLNCWVCRIEGMTVPICICYIFNTILDSASWSCEIAQRTLVGIGYHKVETNFSNILYKNKIGYFHNTFIYFLRAT